VSEEDRASRNNLTKTVRRMSGPDKVQDGKPTKVGGRSEEDRNRKVTAKKKAVLSEGFTRKKTGIGAKGIEVTS